jgi:Putative auto-transporter adhesin, head GIN domain
MFHKYLYLILLISLNAYPQIAINGGGNTVIGDGTVGGITLVTNGQKLILNGTKVYDNAGNVSDAIKESGAIIRKKFEVIGEIVDFDFHNSITAVYDPSLIGYFEISGIENIIENIKYSLINGKLIISLNTGAYYLKNPIHVKFGGAIKNFNFQGSSKMIFKNINNSDIKISTSGSSTLIITNSKIKNLDIRTSGSSKIIATNNVSIANANVDTSGSSLIALSAVDNIYVTGGGSSSIYIDELVGKLDIKSRGSSSLIIGNRL